jgi:HlyD family secretion protein
LAVVAVAAVVGWTLWQQSQTVQAQADELASRRTQTIERGDLSATINATGSLQPDQLANVSFLSPGTVEEVLVKSGDAVRVGQALVRLDAADLQLAVAQAEDALRIAELRRQKLLAGPSEDDIAIARANLRAANAAAYDIQRGAGPQEAQIARLNYDEAAENFRKLNEQYNNLVQFANDNPQFAPPQDTLDQLKQNQENAYYQAEIARLQYEQARNPADPGSLTAAYARIAQAQAQLDQLLAKPTQVQLDQADLAVAQAQLALDQARNRLARAELRAPIAGVVSAVNVRVGEPAPTGAPAVVLLDTDRFRLDVTVNEVDVAQLAVDQPVQVTVEALPDTPLTGKVDRIAPTSVVQGGAVNYVVRIVLDETEAGLRAGMSATVEVTVAEVTGVVLAPNWAIRRDRQTGQAFLSIQRGDALVEVPIETGLRGEALTEVISGAQPGDVAAISTRRELPVGGGG